MSKINKFITIFDGAVADGVGVTMPVKDFDSVVIATSGVWGTTTILFKVQGAIGKSAPTFSTAQSVTNHWDYVQIVDLQDGANIPGDTGVTLAAASYNLYEINTSHLDYINIDLDRTAGSFSAVARANNTWY